jgi:hypothetical protein
VVRFVHIVWSAATGPIAVYSNPDLAWTHARSMLGVDVASMPVSAELPPIVREDLDSDFDDDDNTPVNVRWRGDGERDR